MRWKVRPYPGDGNMRMIRRFLLFPCRIDGEVHWLEWAYIRQMYNASWGDPYWSNLSWGIKEDWIHYLSGPLAYQ